MWLDSCFDFNPPSLPGSPLATDPLPQEALPTTLRAPTLALDTSDEVLPEDNEPEDDDDDELDVPEALASTTVPECWPPMSSASAYLSSSSCKVVSVDAIVLQRRPEQISHSHQQ